MNYYTEKFSGKFAGYDLAGAAQIRMTPFFDTVQQVKDFQDKQGWSTDCIRPVANWQEVIAGRNDYNTWTMLSPGQ